LLNFKGIINLDKKRYRSRFFTKLKRIKLLEYFDILVVEDNPGDARLIEEALHVNKNNYHLHMVEDGVEAMNFLYRKGKYLNSPRPDLIFLDLNLPKRDGREVLAEIKSDRNLQQIPVVIMTTSQAEEDILKAYSLHANCFVTKPLELDQFNKAIESLIEFWCVLVKLPRKEYALKNTI
jgi:two-component system, chemotaxis family, response regulator Rcp1